jgi:hypothetical protein
VCQSHIVRARQIEERRRFKFIIRFHDYVPLSHSVTLTQDGNPTEAAQADATRNWEAMLAGLKEFLER